MKKLHFIYETSGVIITGSYNLKRLEFYILKWQTERETRILHKRKKNYFPKNLSKYSENDQQEGKKIQN